MDDAERAWYIPLPGTGGKQVIGFIKTDDIAQQSSGIVELYEFNDVPTGTEVDVFNPHGVTFYAENTTPGEEHPADRVILFEAKGWPEPLIFPFMLSACADLVPTFDPVDI